jgi:hypothetical protein
MTHVIIFTLNLQSIETNSTIRLAWSPMANKAAPNVEHKKIKPSKFKPRRLPGDLFKYNSPLVRFFVASPLFLLTISNIVSYSLNEISTILSGNEFLFMNKKS